VESNAKDYPPSIAQKAAGLGTLIQEALADVSFVMKAGQIYKRDQALHKNHSRE
jgi:hypothetical protein